MAEDELLNTLIDLPGGELRLLQPADGVELPDDGAIEWAPLVPYWAVLWRSGVALARELAGLELRGLRLVELGCGLGVPSIVAARAGASVLATDESAEALALLRRNAAANGAALETLVADWASPDELVSRGPFDLALAADVAYEPRSVDALHALLPRLAPEALLADPGRPGAEALLGRLKLRTPAQTRARGVVSVHRLELAAPPGRGLHSPACTTRS